MSDLHSSKLVDYETQSRFACSISEQFQTTGCFVRRIFFSSAAVVAERIFCVVNTPREALAIDVTELGLWCVACTIVNGRVPGGGLGLGLRRHPKTYRGDGDEHQRGRQYWR
jgi:hypothetical protein